MSEEFKTDWQKRPEESKQKYHMHHKQVREEKVAKGECLHCSSPAVGSLLCEAHAEQKRQRARKRMEELRSGGRRCPDCSVFLAKGERKCTECKIKGKAQYEEKRRSPEYCHRCGKVPPEDGKTTCRPCRKVASNGATRRKDALKAKVIAGYGGACACCGETYHLFLSVDHINNDGGQKRKEGYQGGPTFYKWIIDNKFPSDLQILCHNCNFAKHLNGGICPHQFCQQPLQHSASYLPICINPHTTGIDKDGQPYPL